ncbi:carboxypeptidase-like regulatory domain-containing protein [[Eubacterium] cellulosolvens]
MIKILISAMLVIILFSNLIEMINSAESLNLTISINKETFTRGEIVIISGMVSDTNNGGVSNAIISIQVNDPNNKMVHIAMVISGSDGRFSNQFIISSGQLNGQYTVFVTASKSGYPDATMHANYTVIPDTATTETTTPTTTLTTTPTTTLTTTPTTTLTTPTTTLETTTMTPATPVPGFPPSSILLGLLIAIITLIMIRRAKT